MPIGTIIAIAIYLLIMLAMLGGIVAVTIDGCKRDDPGAILLVLFLLLMMMLAGGGGGALIHQLLYGA